MEMIRGKLRAKLKKLLEISSCLFLLVVLGRLVLDQDSWWGVGKGLFVEPGVVFVAEV